METEAIITSQGHYCPAGKLNSFTRIIAIEATNFELGGITKAD
jgi:hypothetical protein